MRVLAMFAMVALVGCAAAPTGTPVPERQRLERVAMAARVREEFPHAWEGYKRYAWGHDELKPLSRGARDWYGGSLLITPVDALDTLLLLGEKEEAERTRAYIVANLSFDKDISVKNFEITIRVLGGLLSASQIGRQHILIIKVSFPGRDPTR